MNVSWGWRSIVPLVLAGAFLAALGWWVLQPQPTLIGVDQLLETRRFDDAEERLTAYVHAHPQDPQARLMLARSAVERSDPKPDLALEQLRWVRPTDPHMGAEAKGLEGEARFLQQHFDDAERLWLASLSLDPKIPAVGWGLLNLYALQGRDDESRRLGLRLFEVETDPHDRIQLLLQLIRHDAHAIAPSSTIFELDPVVKANPDDRHSARALGLALVRESRYDAGLAILAGAVKSDPSDLPAWEAYVTALTEAARIDALSETLTQLPQSIAGNPCFDAARGWAATQRREWEAAARSYGRAWERRPDDPTLAYRLQLALRNAGKTEELDRLAPRLKAIASAKENLRTLYDRLDALPDLGKAPHWELYKEMSQTLEQLQRQDEARAWRRVAEAEQPTGS
jgi:tetratricopeptide (TPR) repeat protein